MFNKIENSPVIIVPEVNEYPSDIGSIFDVSTTSVPISQPLAEKVQNAVNKDIIALQPIADNVCAIALGCINA